MERILIGVSHPTQKLKLISGEAQQVHIPKTKHKPNPFEILKYNYPYQLVCMVEKLMKRSFSMSYDSTI